MIGAVRRRQEKGEVLNFASQIDLACRRCRGGSAGVQSLLLLQVFALLTRPSRRQSSSRPIFKLPRHSGRLELVDWLAGWLAGWSIKIPTALLLTCAAGTHVVRAIPPPSLPFFFLIDFDGQRQVPALSVTERRSSDGNARNQSGGTATSLGSAQLRSALSPSEELF